MDHVWLVAIGATAAGFVQGLSGFAFGLVAMAFWAGTLPPQVAAPLVVLCSLLGQTLSIGRLRAHMRPRLLAPFLAGGMIGVPLGAMLLRHVDPLAFRAFVGVLLSTYCPFLLFARNLPAVRGGGWPADLLVGVTGGVMGGLGGLNGPAPTLWCALRGWDRNTQRAVFQGFILTTHALTALSYGAAGVLTPRIWPLFGVAAVAMLVPVLVGRRLYDRISERAFRRVVLGLLFLSGLALLADSVPRLV